jgi:LAO/AO transport system kinase
VNEAASRAARIRAGDVRAAAGLMREIDDRRPQAEEALRLLYAHSGQARVVGVTGPPGAGKSTLIDALIAAFRAQGQRVGVVAVDPSSAITGGAVLADRIRMQRHTLDDGVFIRSLATRGQLGGLSRAAADVVTVLDAMGFPLVLVETVGVGQDEVDVARLADLVVVVTVPGLGDGVQTLKAGLLEIADLFVVNKADREGADRAAADLTAMLGLREEPGPDPDPEVLKVVATSGQGIPELVQALGRHRLWQPGEALAARRQRQALARLHLLLEDRLRQRAEVALQALGGIDALAEAVAARRLDPYTAAGRILGETGN